MIVEPQRLWWIDEEECEGGSNIRKYWHLWILTMPTSSFDPSPDDVVVTYNWPNSCTNPSFLGRNRPQRLELEDFEDDSFHPQSYVFERIHCMEEEEEVGRPYHNPHPNISAKLLFCKILKFGDTFCKHVWLLQFHWQKWMNLIGGSSQLPVPTMWNYSTCTHFRSKKQRRLRIKDDSCKSNPPLPVVKLIQVELHSSYVFTDMMQT